MMFPCKQTATKMQQLFGAEAEDREGEKKTSKLQLLSG